MKNANGTGSIYKLQGHRRKPWVLSFSFWNDNHTKRSRKIIGYYKTKTDAETVRFDVLKSNYALETLLMNKDTTFKDCALESLKRAENNLSELTIKSYESCLKILSPIHNVKMKDFNALMYQQFVDELISNGIKAKRLSNINSLVRRTVKVAIRKGILTYDITQGIDVGGASKVKDRDRHPFTHEELKHLWSLDDDMAKMILVLVYTGLRVDEFHHISKKDYSNGSLTVNKSKTKAGIRTIPIADCIKPYVDYLFDKYDKLHPYNSIERFRWWFKDYVSKLNQDHIIHETRYTFATLLDEARLEDGNRIDIMVIKVLLGHKVSDITKGIYTHENYSRLQEAVNSIQCDF